MLQILKLKFAIIYRDVISMPLLVYVFFFFLIAGVLIVAYHLLETSRYLYILATLVTFILYSKHTKRADFNFCRLMIKKPQKLFVIEYMVICLPLIILSTVVKNYSSMVFYTILPIIIATLPIKTPKVFLLKNLYLFNITSLELIAFLRKYYFLILLLIVISIGTCFIPVLSMIILMLILVAMSEAYTENEPLNIILLLELNPRRFINSKINEGFLLFIKLSLPTLILYPIFNFNTFYLSLIMPLIAYIGIAFFVGLKYSHYENNNSKVTQSLIAGIGVLGLIIPMFLPITIVMAFSYYSNAVDNLKKYLYVYNK